MSEYREFIAGKTHLAGQFGFAPVFMPDFLFPFQSELVDWALRKGRAAIFADCGLGKTPMQLVWAQNVAEHTAGRVLILTPLSVAAQTVREGEKFDICCQQSRDGSLPGANIVVTNYEQLHKFDPADFIGCVGDESSCIKSTTSATRALVTGFMRQLPYRLLCTATAAPNDYIELGTSSEALGAMGNADMLSRFFKRDTAFYRQENRGGQGWHLRPYAEHDFWRWVCSWARAVRRPSDMGYPDGDFTLPPMEAREHIVKASRPRDGMLFDLPAVTLDEQREERRRTLPERCELAARLVNDTGEPAVCWCYLNDEGDELTRRIPDATQISGSDSDERKEEVLAAFASGGIRVLVSKPTITGYGLNWQHCAHQTFFPSHSFEQWYQATRRSWRFGQTRPVRVDIIASEGERGVLDNLQRKAKAADAMFRHLVALMHNELDITTTHTSTPPTEIAQWLSRQ